MMKRKFANPLWPPFWLQVWLWVGAVGVFFVAVLWKAWAPIVVVPLMVGGCLTVGVIREAGAEGRWIAQQRKFWGRPKGEEATKMPQPLHWRNVVKVGDVCAYDPPSVLGVPAGAPVAWVTPGGMVDSISASIPSRVVRGVGDGTGQANDLREIGDPVAEDGPCEVEVCMQDDGGYDQVVWKGTAERKYHGTSCVDSVRAGKTLRAEVFLDNLSPPVSYDVLTRFARG